MLHRVTQCYTIFTNKAYHYLFIYEYNTILVTGCYSCYTVFSPKTLKLRVPPKIAIDIQRYNLFSKKMPKNAPPSFCGNNVPFSVNSVPSVQKKKVAT